MPVASHESSRSVYEPDVKFWGVHVLRRLQIWLRACICVAWDIGQDGCADVQVWAVPNSGMISVSNSASIWRPEVNNCDNADQQSHQDRAVVIIIVAFTPVLAFSAITL